jgi:signal transduction histidine kinase/ActR/RegA family two-component response regulator
MPHRPPATFRYRVYNGLLLFAVTVVMGTSLLSLRATNEMQASVELASDTQRVLQEISSFWGLMGDSESHGLRFAITGSEPFLLEYRRTVLAMNKSLDLLQQLVRDHPTQAANVEALRQLHTRRLQYGATTQALQLQANRGSGAAGQAMKQRLNEGVGARMGAEMRVLIEQMIRMEGELLERRNEERNQMIRQNWATVLVANALALVAGLFGFSATRRMQRQAAETFRAAVQAEQARRTSQEKSVFLASMSHEIRTPMNAIFGFTNLLAERTTDPVQADYVASIRKSGQALLSLINDVLDLSKMEAGKLELREEPTDLREVVDQVLTMFRQTAADKGIGLAAEFSGQSDSPLLVDPVRLRQVLINLVSNAVKYTEQGGVMLRISCVPCKRDGHCDLRIEVRDSGTGIAAHQLGVIFEPFEQGDSIDGKSREGTGLGLSIARRLADLMGGTLRADSTLGEGSSFTLDIPDRAITDAPVSLQPSTGPSVDFDRLPPLKLLVVDDVAWNRDLALAYLRDTHHTVRQADDGIAALVDIREQRPDVVLMDLRMPRLSGEQALLRIKSDPLSANLPVIAVTASSMSEDEHWLRQRFDGYVRKPYSKVDLFEALAAHFPPLPEAAAAGDTAAAPVSEGEPGPGREDAGAMAELRELAGDARQRLRASLRMREVGHYADRLHALAAALDWPALAAHAARLHAAVEAFDVPAVKRLLDASPLPEESRDD